MEVTETHLDDVKVRVFLGELSSLIFHPIS